MDEIDANLDRLPLLVVFSALVALLLVFYEVGYRLAKARSGHEPGNVTHVGAIVAGELGLLALIMAFTFNMATARFDARKHAVIDEANAIGTAWLRASLLPAPHAEEVQSLLARYVAVRVEAARSTSAAEVSRAITESKSLQDQLWQHATEMGLAAPRSVPVGLFVEALNHVIDLHEERVSFALRYRIAGGVWLTLGFLALTAMTLAGAHGGILGSRTWAVSGLLVLTLSATLTLIVDMDRSRQTLFSVNQGPLIELQADFAKPSHVEEKNSAGALRH